ncbi:MAG: sodium-dependent transporter, partial [Aristaeellaceae bacterium]
SAVSVMEAIVACLMDQFHISRAKATLLETAICLVLALLVCLGYNALYFDLLLPNGNHAQLLDVMDYVSNNFLMPVVAIGTCILVGWVVKPRTVIDEIERSSGRFGRKKLYVVMIKVIAPILLTVLLLKSVGILTVI